MSVLVLLATDDAQFEQALQQAAQRQKNPQVEWISADDPRASEARVAACWYPPGDLLERFPDLQCLHALSAGVDHLGPNLLRSGLPVCRIVDDQQKAGMLEYILWGVLYFQRDMDRVLRNQAEHRWYRYPQHSAAQTRVGIMGMGRIGAHVARGLAELGYQVNGWARSDKTVNNVSTFAGDKGLTPFLEQSDILVNLLPLNEQTQGILCRDLFAHLPPDAAVINCGRGGHLIEADLLNALESGALRGAIVDVFDSEPLASEHPFWDQPKVLVTPHMASSSSMEVLVRQISENAQRLLAGEDLRNQISADKGY